MSSESLVRWNVPSVPWRYLVQENAKPITIKAITKDTQTALTCVASDVDKSIDGNSESNRVPRPHAKELKHGREDVKCKDHVLDHDCVEKLNKGVQTPRHTGVQTENQAGNEGSFDVSRSYCSTKEGSSRKDPVSKSTQAGSPQTKEFKSTKTFETSSNPTRTQTTKQLSAPREMPIDSNNRTCKDRLIKARKGRKRTWRKNRRSPIRETLISNLVEMQVTPTCAPRSEEVIGCGSPSEEKTQANADDVEARKLHVQPTLPMSIPVKCTTPISNTPLAKHEPAPNVAAEDVQVQEIGHKSDVALQSVEEFDTKLEKEPLSISNFCRDAPTEGQNLYLGTACIQLDSTEGTAPEGATKETILQQNESDNYLLRITSNKKTTDKSVQTKNAYNVSSSRQRKKKGKTTRSVQESARPVESVSIASSTESLEALERLIEMQHAELVSKGPVSTLTRSCRTLP